MLAITALMASGATSVAAAYEVSAWTFGDRASLDAATSRGAIDAVAVDWYASLPNGGLRTDRSEDLTFVAEARSRGLRVAATVTNLSRKTWDFDPALAHRLLTSRKLRNRHISRIVSLCVSKGYDGIDLDWESLYETDRDRFSQFVERLAAALHPKGKYLAIAVHAKTSEPGGWSGARAEDYKRLGAAVDEFNVMTYDYSGSWSHPGPISPPDWADAVLAFAESVVAPGKIRMGVPFYGYDWVGSDADGVLWSDVQSLIAEYAPTLVRDSSGEVTFNYQDQSARTHTVFFQDRTAIGIKLQMLLDKHPSIAGIGIWVMGDEDPGFWDEIVAKLKSARGK
ncbi:MAG: glycosyl hydrolase family 18 protein [Acidobacteriota bacterium]